MDKVSVIIPTFNRFKYVLNTIKSMKAQTHPNIEIIVVNDSSTQPEYYGHDWVAEGVTIIHLTQNSRSLFGFACAAYVRNKGAEVATGRYLAFCDDDDIWFPNKLELQINAMKTAGCEMSCTDGLIGNGPYDASKTYSKYNAEHYYSILQSIYRNKGSPLMENGFPSSWSQDFIRVHNCIICSSVVMYSDLFITINGFNLIKPPGEDYDCWLRALAHTDCVYVTDICFYYDAGHGDGQNY